MKTPKHIAETPHFNPENFFEKGDRWYYVDPNGKWHDIHDMPFAWKCKKGHEWYATIQERIADPVCPKCKGDKGV